MKGLGTEENVIVEVIGSHTNEQRQEIKDKYKTMYGKVCVTQVSILFYSCLKDRTYTNSFIVIWIAILQFGSINRV